MDGALGIIALILLPLFSAIHHNPYGIISGIIMGISMIVLYTMSSIYHGLSPNLKAKKVFQIFDHCAIFLLIAGTYTPFCLCTLRNYNTKLGWTIFAIIWTTAIFGIIINSIDIKKYKIISMICYLLMGWCIIFKISILPSLLTKTGFYLLLAGGIVYSLGAILYILGKKKKYIHSIFHIFILIATMLHFLCVLLYVC